MKVCWNGSDAYIDDINRIYNNKALYATDKLVQHMFSNEKYHYRLSGGLEDVKEVTLNDLNDAYDDLRTIQ